MQSKPPQQGRDASSSAGSGDREAKDSLKNIKAKTPAFKENAEYRFEVEELVGDCERPLFFGMVASGGFLLVGTVALLY